MPTGGPRLALSVTGAVFMNNKWNPNIQFTCRAINLGNRSRNGSRGGGVKDTLLMQCQDTWNSEAGGYTWIEGKEKSIEVKKLPMYSLCFRGKGMIPVRVNRN